MKSDRLESNSKVVNREMRQELKCDRCPPNQGENGFGKRKPRADKYKAARKGKT